jgi:FkbH-like protein
MMKKCLVLDLDNTLWGGVVGEDGIDNLALSVSAPGNSFLAFQQAILDYYNKGVILAINSRNNEEDAWNVIRNHPNQILKEHHFAAYRINWNDKAQNIIELAKELNIGLDSMVFIDDDKTNRELVKSLVPEVEVPDLPEDPKEYTKFLNSLNYFSSETITDEDKMRGNLYVTERLRKEAEKEHENKEEFLASLQLELFIYENDASCIPRLAQLTEKTNQFNTHKQPFTESEIQGFIESSHHKVLYGRLQDAFGDYGVIIFGIIDMLGETWHIRSLLMSCRVFGRNVEDAFLSDILERALPENVTRLTIDFVPSEKNAPAREFVERYFNNGEMRVSEKINNPKWITITHENI